MASLTPYATNNHDVRTNPIDFDAPGSVTSKTYHGLTIVVAGKVIGRVESWQPQMFNRGGQHVHELNNFTFGRPVDYVPGVATNFTVQASRTEVWYQEFEVALGFPAVWADLIDQDRPFEVHEQLYRGKSLYRVWVYSGCWFQDKNEDQATSTSDAPKILVNSTIAFVSRRRTVG